MLKRAVSRDGAVVECGDWVGRRGGYEMCGGLGGGGMAGSWTLGVGVCACVECGCCCM